MSEILIRIPEELKGLGEAFQDILNRVQEKVNAAGEGRAVDYARVELEIAGDASKLKQAAHAAILQALDVESGFESLPPSPDGSKGSTP